MLYTSHYQLHTTPKPPGFVYDKFRGFYMLYTLSSACAINLPDRLQSIGEVAFGDCKSLENITFGGTKEQWEKIVKGEDWHKDIPAKVVHCSDGEIEI